MKHQLLITAFILTMSGKALAASGIDKDAITVCTTKVCATEPVPGVQTFSVKESGIGSFFDLASLFDTSLWPARWHCGIWTPVHGWIYIISDLLIWLAYFTIPAILVFFLLRRGTEGIPFRSVFILFIGFILLCGLTHLIDAAIFWWPAYKLSAALRLGTASISIFTVFALVRVIPSVLELKSPAYLERIVLERTKELSALNEQLKQEILEKKKKDESLFHTNQELLAFSYSVSHDLRTPLRSIHGFSNALLEDYTEKLDDTGKDFLNRICMASSRMGELIDDLLKLSRISRNETKVDNICLSSITNDVIAAYTERKPGTHATFVIEPGVNGHGDAKLVKIAIENLVDNAIKYSSKKKDPKIEFGKLPNADVYFIRDNGAGFDMLYSDKLFGAFQRLHEGDYEGSGIGLATVKRIITKHGGRIWAEGAVDEGATFYFTLTS